MNASHPQALQAFVRKVRFLLLFREALDQDKPAAEFMSPALFIDEDTRLEIALRRMQRAGERLAIVLTRDRREAGVASLGDILKLMFGEVKL